MQYLLAVTDSRSGQMVVLTLDEQAVKHAAIDVVFEFLGTDNPDALVEKGILPGGQLEDFTSVKNAIFDSDEQGKFIRNEVNFFANEKELNPDVPMIGAFLLAQKEGIEYRRCNLSVTGTKQQDGADLQQIPSSQQGTIAELSNLMFLHQIAVGANVDVTKEIAELTEAIAWAEKEGLIEIDVKSASYKLTEKGRRYHSSYIEEAQSLIRRYDIFGDVDIDGSGTAHFDTGLGRDLRVAVYEMEGVDPFRARFLLGLNDGEWDGMEDWPELMQNEKWYHEIFKLIESAPTVEDIGRERVQSVIDQGKRALRQEMT